MYFECLEGMSPLGGSGGMPPRKIFSKKGSRDAIRGILGTLRQEKMCNNNNYSDNKIFICLPILIQSLLIIFLTFKSFYFSQ